MTNKYEKKTVLHFVFWLEEKPLNCVSKTISFGVNVLPLKDYCSKKS